MQPISRYVSWPLCHDTYRIATWYIFPVLVLTFVFIETPGIFICSGNLKRVSETAGKSESHDRYTATGICITAVEFVCLLCFFGITRFTRSPRSFQACLYKSQLTASLPPVPVAGGKLTTSPPRQFVKVSYSKRLHRDVAPPPRTLSG